MSHVNRFGRRAALLSGAVFVGFLATAAAYVEIVAASDAPVATPAQQVATVQVRTMRPQHVQVWTNFSGRLTAVDAADLRPEVGGRITEIRFEDGATVKHGDVLFVIDPSPYQAAVSKSEADLASAKTKAKLAHDDLARAAKLVKTHNLAESAFDTRDNAARVADANVQAAEAALAEAQVNLDRAYLKAPIDGVISRAEITVGNVVQAGAGAPLLASIVSNDGIYADFEVDEATYLASRRGTAIPVELSLKSADKASYTGTLKSFDNKIDTGSGTIRARARFANEDGALVPGMFVSVRLAAHDDMSALVVPERSIGADQDKKYVYVVEPDNKTAYREITLGAAVGNDRVVTAGLSTGDRVVLDGVQSVTPGAPVRVTEAVADNR